MGARVVVTIAGPAGTGKSAMATVLMRALENAGVNVTYEGHDESTIRSKTDVVVLAVLTSLAGKVDVHVREAMTNKGSTANKRRRRS